ncbi:MAG TPA: hypothetical protein PLA94_10850 [Myxococcota bacterium]|nr:hypothetical protein [Myxococcota bacterium]HND30491.1 hypothetical protein [Myxococcota bacterium]
MRWSVLPLLSLLACQQDYSVTAIPPNVDPGDVTECGFTRVDQTDYYRYDCNPVFSTTGEGWAPTIGSTAFAVTEVLGHPFYQIWYQGVPDDTAAGGYGLGYAASPDGTVWTPYPDNPLLTEPSGGGAFDASSMDAMQVLWDSGTEQYLMLYQGVNLDKSLWGLGVATSSDGHTWARLPSNPVLDLTEPKGKVNGYCWPLGLTKGDIAGFTGYIAGYTSPNGPCEAFRINSPNLRDWEPDTNVIFEAGKAGKWDDQGQLSLAIANLKKERHMFYVGFGDWEDHPGYRTTKNQFLGHATWDGSAWQRDADPLPLHNTEGGDVNAVAAVTVGKRIHLWVTDAYTLDDGTETQAVGYFLYDPDREEEE